MSQRRLMSVVVHISGPGGKAFGVREVCESMDAFRKHGANVIPVGNGLLDIKLDDIEHAFSRVPNTDDNIIVYILMHGYIRDGQHFLEADRGHNLPSKGIFDLAAKKFRTPIDMVTAACSGGASARYTSILPKGSTFASFTSPHGDVSVEDVDRFAKTLASQSLKTDLSAKNLLNIFMMRCLQYKMMPCIATSGIGIYDFKPSFKGMIGKSFTQEEQASIHQKLGGMLSKEEIDSAMRAIKSAKSIKDINAEIFGPAAAAVMAATFPKVIDFKFMDISQQLEKRHTIS